MKKSFLLTGGFMLLIWVSISCSDAHHDTKISISESKDTYQMSAWFNPGKTSEVHKYMDQKLGKHNEMSFVNAEIDGTITLDDHTVFYLKSLPGDLEIELDKSENSQESYQQVKEMCEGIKKVIEGK